MKKSISTASYDNDTYDVGLTCQLIIIDGVTDSDYSLKATANVPSVQAAKTGKGKVIIPEYNYENNTVEARLRIRGDSVT